MKQKIMNRKDFVKTSGRFLLLAGITVSSGFLVIRNKVTTTCTISSACKNCGKFSACELPQAKEAKNGKEE